jgi:hypothetical protein
MTRRLGLVVAFVTLFMVTAPTSAQDPAGCISPPPPFANSGNATPSKCSRSWASPAPITSCITSRTRSTLGSGGNARNG